MPTEEENANRIRKFARNRLLKLWAQITARDAQDWGSGKALEYLVLRAFQVEGAAVTWPFDVKAEGKTIEQIDGVIFSDSISSLVECKDYAIPVNFEPIAKLKQQLSRRPPGTIGCCFAKNGFTQEALILTERSTPQNVLLWHGDEIEFALRTKCFRRGLIRKYRMCVEKALPDFKINLEDRI